MVSSGANRQINHANINFSFSTFVHLVGYIGCYFAKVSMYAVANISLLIKQNQILSDADQNNVACKQSAIGCVVNVFSFVTMGRHVVLCFQRFVQHLDQTLEKVANALRNIFIH